MNYIIYTIYSLREDIMNKKIFIAILILFMLFLGLGVVSASESNEGSFLSSEMAAEELAISEDNAIDTESAAVSNDVQSDTTELTEMVADNNYNSSYESSSGNFEENNNSDSLSITEIVIEAPSSIEVNTTRRVEMNINITSGLDYIDFDIDDLNIAVTYLDENNETKIADISNIELENGIVSFTLDNNNFTKGN